MFTYLIVFIPIISMRDIENIVWQIQKQMKEKEKRDNRHDETRAIEDLKMPVGFECYVCGTKFVTNEERKHHLKKSDSWPLI
jgi:hypothetical protein